MEYTVRGIKLPLVDVGENLAKHFKGKLEDGEILIIAQTIVSKSEGSLIDLKKVKPSKKALKLSEETGKNPSICQVILDQGELVACGPGVVITEVEGRICANSGVDSSNSPPGKITILPEDPDLSAERIREEIEEDVAVLISDSTGRPFRLGAAGEAIGCSGLKPLKSHVGETDLYKKTLKTSEECIADELASAANIVLGESDRGIPAAVINGINVEGNGSAKKLNRPKSERLFSPGRW